MATTFPTPMSAAPAPGGGGGGGSGNAFKDTTFAPGGGVGGRTLASSSNGRSPGDDALSSLQTLWGTPTTSAPTAGAIGGGGGDLAIAGHGSGGGCREASAAPSNRDPASGGRDDLRKPERSVLRRTPSVRCAVDAYATRVLRSASPPEMRDAVDDSLGPYITSLLRDIVGDDGEATTASMLEPLPKLTDLDEYDNLIELVVEHCAVSTPGVATDALEAIYDAVCTGRIPPASPPAGGDGDVVETQRKSLETSLAVDVSSFRAATLDPWSTDAAAAEGEVLQQQRKLPTYVDGTLEAAAVDNGKAADRALVQVTPEDVDEDLEKLVGRMVFTDEEEENGGGANRLASDLLAVMDESSFQVPKKPNADLESTTTTSSTEEGERTPSHQALHTIASDGMVANVNAELAAVTSSAGVFPGGRIDSDSCGGEKQQMNRDGSGKKKRSSLNNDSEAKDLAAALFRPARPRSNSNLSDGNKRRSPTFGTGTGTGGGSGAAGGGAHAAYPSYPLPPSSPPTYPTAPPSHSTNVAYSNYQQHYDPNFASDVDPSSSLPQDRQRHHPPPGEDNLQLYHLASEQLLAYNPDLSPEAAWEASTLVGGDVQLAYQVIDQAANATPVCRHMLSHACYRSDCQFSHDVEGHTCAFWLRGRCGKGGECRFLHGFHERTLQGATTAAAAAAAAATVSGKPPQPSRPRPHSFLSNPSTSSALTGGSGGGGGVGVGVGVGGIDTDRQRHLLGSEFLDGTLSDWDNDERVAGAGGSGSGGNNDTTSFASIASRGGGAIGLAPDSSPAAAFAQTGNTYDSAPLGSATRRGDRRNVRTVRIPQHLWNASVNRNPELFYVEDPIERYYAVNSPTSSGSRAGGGNGDDVVMDLHFQSEKTAPIVLAALLPEKLRWRGTAPARSDYDIGSTNPRGVWIVTGSGHHVNERSHQRGGGVLENAVMDWLDENEFEYYRGKDRNGYGGAVLVVR